MSLDVELVRAAAASPAVTPFELDIQEVLGLLGNSETADSNLAESPDFGLDCAVETVQPAEQAALELAECPVCGNQWARPRFAIPGIDASRRRLHAMRTGPAASAAAAAR